MRKEAVFSSSEDQIRASQASVAVAGPCIVPRTPPSWISRAAESVFAVLVPAGCRICAAPLVRISRLPVCVDCLGQLLPVPGQLCSVCGERVLSPHIVSVADGQKLCPACSHAAQHFAKAVAFGSCEGVLRELVHLLKYSGVRPAASVLGKLLAEAISGRGLFREAGPELSPVLVVPVPLYRSKRSERGFNHAESIAQAALKLLTNEQRLGRELVLRQDILERKRATQSQTGLTIKQRRENVRGAFAVRRAQEVNGCEVLLVDDVYTTGATVSECARVLRRAGAEKVWVATVARTLASQYGEMKPAVGVASCEMAGTPLSRAVS